MKRNHPPTKLDKHIDKESNPPHWMWLGAQLSSGKGAFARTTDGHSTTARRAVLEFMYGELPDTVKVQRTCNEPLCVNPDCGEVTVTSRDENRLNAARELLKNPRNNLAFVSRHTGVPTKVCRKLRQEMQTSDEQE